MLKADVEVDRRDFTVRAAITVAPGERLALFGPSGAGKTTLLEAIAGLVEPRSGTIELAGRVLTRTSTPRVAVPPWQRRVGLLRQDPGLFPHLSVRANLAYGRTAHTARAVGADARAAGGAPGPAGDGELTELADALGIAGLLSAMPGRLSGGQQHRVALARLLLAHCDALLLDEPYSGLDAALRRTLTALVVRLVTERNAPAILVAHELADAQAFATRLAVIDRGRLLQFGSPDAVVLRPASVRVAELVGYLGFVAVPGRPGVTAGIHPDRVVVGSVPGRGLALSGPVVASRPAGAGWEVDLLLPGAQPPGSVVTCRLAVRPTLDGGEATVTAMDAPLFGPDGMSLAADRHGASLCTGPGAGPDGVSLEAGPDGVPRDAGRHGASLGAGSGGASLDAGPDGVSPAAGSHGASLGAGPDGASLDAGPDGVSPAAGRHGLSLGAGPGGASFDARPDGTAHGARGTRIGATAADARPARTPGLRRAEEGNRR